MRPLAIEAEGMKERADDRLDDLALAREPAPQRLGPELCAAAPGWAEHRRPVGLRPAPVPVFALEAAIRDIGAGGGSAGAGSVALAENATIPSMC